MEDLVRREKNLRDDSWLEDFQPDALAEGPLPDAERIASHDLDNEINYEIYCDMDGEAGWDANLDIGGKEIEMNPQVALSAISRFKEDGLEGLEPDFDSVDELLETIAGSTGVPKNTRRAGYEFVVLYGALDDYERIRHWGYQGQCITVEELLKPVGYQHQELFDGRDEDGVPKEGEVRYDVDQEGTRVNGNRALQYVPHTVGLVNWRDNADGRTESGAVINFDVETGDEMVYLYIYDNGPGFDFTETSRDELTSFETEGIGMPVSKYQVEMVGGTFELGHRQELDGEEGAYIKVGLPRYDR